MIAMGFTTATRREELLAGKMRVALWRWDDVSVIDLQEPRRVIGSAVSLIFVQRQDPHQRTLLCDRRQRRILCH